MKKQLSMILTFMFCILLISSTFAQQRPTEFKKHKSVHQWDFMPDLTKNQIDKIDAIETDENGKVAELWSHILKEEGELEKMKSTPGTPPSDIEGKQRQVFELYGRVEKERALAESAILKELTPTQREIYKKHMK